MSTGYNFNTSKGKPMRAFAAEYKTSSNKLLDYLREKDILSTNNSPKIAYQDWFRREFKGKYADRYDLTPLGEEKIREMIKVDGIDYVKNRNPNGSNRNGNMSDPGRYNLA